MKLLSIDVGIKNLAFCLFEKAETNYIIKKWDIINLSTNLVSSEEKYKCCDTEKNGKPCNKPAKFIKNDKCYCLKHSKKQNFLIPTSELKASYINKQKLQSLYDIADKYKIVYEKPIKKQDLVNLINEYIHNTCFQKIEDQNETTNASKIDLITIGKNIKQKFDTIFSDEGIINYVIIENQISPIANRMKTIQGMIVQYFIMTNNTDQYQKIEFVSSINKLKEFKDSTLAAGTGGLGASNEQKGDNYKDRKKMGITKTLEILNDSKSSQNFNTWIQFFMSHKKKDDLADSFLQGSWYIKNKF